MGAATSFLAVPHADWARMGSLICASALIAWTNVIIEEGARWNALGHYRQRAAVGFKERGSE
jgi:hypothetical protein